MSTLSAMRRAFADFSSALQFLTRVPLPLSPYQPNSLARAVKFFPAVGLIVGGMAAAVHLLLISHLSRLPTALFVVGTTVFITGALHEDGLADAADGFGGGWDRSRVLEIMRDSRIGTYGAMALTFSVFTRVLLLSVIASEKIVLYIIAAHVLCRWTALPLSFYLPSARLLDRTKDSSTPTGLGAQVAGTISSRTLMGGTLFSFSLVALLLRTHAWAPLLGTTVVTLLTALYYMRRINGITGDCFGATNQLTEITIYLCGAWLT